MRPSDDKDVVRTSIGPLLSRTFELMEDHAVVYHAANTNTISSALAFLAARRIKRLQSNMKFLNTIQRRGRTSSTGTLVYVRHVLDGVGPSEDELVHSTQYGTAVAGSAITRKMEV